MPAVLNTIFHTLLAIYPGRIVPTAKVASLVQENVHALVTIRLGFHIGYMTTHGLKDTAAVRTTQHQHQTFNKILFSRCYPSSYFCFRAIVSSSWSDRPFFESVSIKLHIWRTTPSDDSTLSNYTLQQSTKAHFVTMNLYAGISTALAILAFPALITGLILPSFPARIPSQTPRPHDTNHWDFDLYNNKRCAGQASNIVGWGSSGCRTDVPVGGARGYALKDLDSACSVALYKDTTCTLKSKIRAIEHESLLKCHAIGGKKYVRSFEVKCR